MEYVENIDMRKILFLLFIVLISCKSQPPVPPEIAEEAEIEIKEPGFEIVSIAIIQADLVNTQFEAVLKINNPNVFALELSALTYELFGNGKFWSNGKGADILHIPAMSSCETEFYFTMNFINMNRRLLDDVIAMRQVRYRFKGDVEVDVSSPRVSPFKMSFERSGLSEVREKVQKNTENEPESKYTSAFQPSGYRENFDRW